MEFWIIATVLFAVVVAWLLFGSTKRQDKVAKASKPTRMVKQSDGSQQNKTFSLEEIATHNHKGSCWIIVEGKVYDVTDYIDEHPGGDAILNNAGRDSTVGFKGPQHPPSVVDVLKLYYIGEAEEAKKR